MKAEIKKAKDGFLLKLYENNDRLESGTLFISNFRIETLERSKTKRIALYIEGTYSGSLYVDIVTI